MKLKKSECFGNKPFINTFFIENEEIFVDEELAKKMYYQQNLSIRFLKDVHERTKENSNKQVLNNWLSLFPYTKMACWNNEFVSKYVNELEGKLDSSNEYNMSLHAKLGCCVKYYINDKEICEKIIDVLERICVKFGFSTVISGTQFFDIDFLTGDLVPYIFCRKLNDIMKERIQNDLDILSFFPHAKFNGFLAILCYNSYFDLLYKFIDKVIAPFLNSLTENNPTTLDLSRANEIYTRCRECLHEAGDEFAQYFDNKIDLLIKNVKI